MITAVHALIYSDDADATRAFLRDVLGFPFVDDGGSGWLIFGTGPSEMGVHPTHSEWEGKVDEGYGLVTMMDVPGADPIQIYQPKHEIAYGLK